MLPDGHNCCCHYEQPGQGGPYSTTPQLLLHLSLASIGVLRSVLEYRVENLGFWHLFSE